MRFVRRLLGAALIAAPLSLLAVILFFVIDDPCGCAHPSDDCGYGYLIGIAILFPVGFVMFLPAWAVSLNASLSLRSRVACGLVASALILGGFAAFGFYAVNQDRPLEQSGGCP